MKHTHILFSALAFTALTAGCGRPAPVQKADEISAGAHTRVTTKYGPIEGYLDGSIYTFKGIRYAKAERFMPPQYPDSFTEVRMCKIYGPQALQTESLVYRDDSQRDYTFGNQFVVEPMSEDCQVLNVWTPGLDAGKRPVFVWIHGGGYTGGSCHDLPCYEGKSLAEKGNIVYVNINHRLNVLGYTDLTALGGKYAESVNLGQQDIVKSLEWIRDNISRFGGDPDNVTIAGQSGGGGKVSTLLAMPSACGLFHKAVVQSGSTLRLGDAESARAYGLALVEELGVTPGPDADLSGFTYEELLDATRRLSARGLRGANGPVVDGNIVIQHPFDGVGPEISKDIPMLIGTDFNEFTFDIRVKESDEQIEENLIRRMGKERAEAYMAAFRKAYPDKAFKEITYVDTNFRPSAVKQAAAKAAQHGAPAYLYLFTWAPKNNALGASHGMELPFMSNNVALQREMTGSTPEAYALEEVISNIWLAFIRTGNPNCKDIPAWDAYNAETSPCMMLDNECRLAYGHDAELLELAASR